jgi:hypothetical protein
MDLRLQTMPDHRRQPPGSGGGDQRPYGSVRADGTKHLTYSELMIGRDGRGLSAVRVFTVTARVARQPLPTARQHACAHRLDRTTDVNCEGRTHGASPRVATTPTRFERSPVSTGSRLTYGGRRSSNSTYDE